MCDSNVLADLGTSDLYLQFKYSCIIQSRVTGFLSSMKKENKLLGNEFFLCETFKLMQNSENNIKNHYYS